MSDLRIREIITKCQNHRSVAGVGQNIPFQDSATTVILQHCLLKSDQLIQHSELGDSGIQQSRLDFLKQSFAFFRRHFAILRLIEVLLQASRKVCTTLKKLNRLLRIAEKICKLHLESLPARSFMKVSGQLKGAL